MSQPEAALYIQPPTLETTVAVHITVNAVWRNGAVNDAALDGVAVALLIQQHGARDSRLRHAKVSLPFGRRTIRCASPR
jgi:hypothetical protein